MTMKMKFASLATVVALAACSGGGGVVPTHPSDKPMAKIAFTMHWPSATASAAARAAAALRRPTFISPSTQSVLVEVNNDASLNTVTNKPSSGNVSTVTVNAPVGSDSITVSTWDQADAKGNELGQITVTQTVVAGTLNTFSATVDGLMEKVGISGAPNPFLESGTDSTNNPTFTLVGTVPQTFTIVPEDVDGNVIVPPGDAPSLSMTSNDASIGVTAVTGKADTYTVQAVAPTAQGASTALVVKGQDGLGNTISAQFGAVESSAIYVGYANGPSSATIGVFDQSGKQLATTGFSGISDASGITFDPTNNRIVIADHALGTLHAFDPQGNPDATFAQPAITAANSVVYDPKDNEYFVTQDTANSISVVSATGALVTLSGTPFAALAAVTGTSEPLGITYDTGQRYVTNGQFQVYVADANYNNSTTDAGPQILAFNPDGTAGTGNAMKYYNSAGLFRALSVVYDGFRDQMFVVGDQYTSSGLTYNLREFGQNYGSNPMITGTTGFNKPSQIALNVLNHELYITNGGDGTIAVYPDDSITSTITQDTSVTFAPPAGLTSAKGIAIVF